MATITIVSPATATTVKGAQVALRAQVDGGATISNVRFEIGYAKYGTVPAVRVRARYYGYTWDSRRSLMDGATRPADSCYWITARAVVDGKEISAPYVRVVTANKQVSGLLRRAGGAPRLPGAHGTTAPSPRGRRVTARRSDLATPR